MKQQNDWSSVNIEEVIKGIGNKDPEAYEEFFNRTVNKAYVIAHKVLGEKGNSADAEDMVQDAYMTAFNSIESLNDPNKAMSWFGIIVGNKCRDHLKKKKAVLFEEMDTDDFSFEDTIENEYLEFIPEEAVDYSETKRLMNEILDNLPKDQKLCTLLFYYNELSVKEIAEVLDCSEGTVKSRLNYSRKKIENEVKALEKKGTKLYSVAPMPFIGWMLRDSETTLIVPETIKAQVLTGMNTGTATVTSAAIKGTVAKSVTAGSATVGKTLVTKVVVGVVAASLAIGGGIFVAKTTDEPMPVEDSITTEEIEDEIINQIDYKYLESLLCYLPVYDVEDSVSDIEMGRIIETAFYFRSLEDDPLNIIADEHFIERRVGETAEELEEIYEETGLYGYVRLDGDTFDDIARIISFDTPIDEEFITGLNDPQYSPTYKWDDGTILYLDVGFGSYPYGWEVKIIDTRSAGGAIEVDYELTFINYVTEISQDMYNTSKRTARLELRENKYVITSIIEVAGPGFGCSVSEVE